MAARPSSGRPLPPFVYRLVPTWSDTDTARIVYTGRYPDFALRAIDAWLLERAGADFYRMNVDWGIGTPFVRLECDFRAPVTPRDCLLILVRVERIGTNSLTFRVVARIEDDGRIAFEGRFVCVCIVAATQADRNSRSIPLDPRLRAAAEADLAAHGKRDARDSQELADGAQDG